MTNQIALWLAGIILLAVIGDVVFYDAFWTETWARRFLSIIDWARFWG